ncbi:hypothetical protein Tco_0175326 [Tanacetum coccineum]
MRTMASLLAYCGRITDSDENRNEPCSWLTPKPCKCMTKGTTPLLVTKHGIRGSPIVETVGSSAGLAATVIFRAYEKKKERNPDNCHGIASIMKWPVFLFFNRIMHEMSISHIKSSSRHEVIIPNPVFRCSEFGGVTDCILALTTQAPGPSRKRSRSPSSLFFLDVITFSNGKPTFETSELNPEDVTVRLEDLEVEIDTLHADAKDKELLISKLQDSLAAAESKIAILQIRVANTESRHAEDHEQIQKVLARLGL